jgi:hypothetical protein
MGRVGFWVSVGRASKDREHCPHCGVGVDEEVPQRPNAGTGR